MEKPKKTERAGLIKNAAIAGLVFLAGGETKAQDIGNWRTVTPAEFARLHIPDSLVQKVSAQEGAVALDPTKAARAYTDARTTFYWINPKTPKTREEILANTPLENQKTISENELAELKAKNKKKTPPEEKDAEDKTLADALKEGSVNTEERLEEASKVETIPQSVYAPKEEPVMESFADAPIEEVANIEEDPTEETPPAISDMPPAVEKNPTELEMDTIMGALEEYADRFEVEEAYFTSSSGQKYKLDDIPSEAFKHLSDKTILSGSVVIHDKDTGERYKVLKRNKDGLTDDIFYFAEALKNSGARRGCLEFLKKKGKLDLPTEERIKYLQEFFTTQIENLRKYKEPGIHESEIKAGTTAQELK